MRLLILPLFALPLMGCEPPEAREAPLDLPGGYYVVDLPAFIPAKFASNSGCMSDFAARALPANLLKVPFSALEGDCSVGEPIRKGNYFTIRGTCKPPRDVAGGTMDIEGKATIDSSGAYGSFKIDMSKTEKTTSDAKKAALLAGLTRFKFTARRTGPC